MLEATEWIVSPKMTLCEAYEMVATLLDCEVGTSEKSKLADLYSLSERLLSLSLCIEDLHQHSVLEIAASSIFLALCFKVSLPT